MLGGFYICNYRENFRLALKNNVIFFTAKTYVVYKLQRIAKLREISPGAPVTRS